MSHQGDITEDVRWITVKGQRIRCLDRGAGEVLLLLHGLTGYIEDWREVLGPLSRQYRVIAPDMLGSGRSDKPEGVDWTQDMLAQSVLDLVDALGIGAFHVGGYSMGGRLALHLAHLAPGRVRSVVALAPAGIGQSTIFEFRAASVPVLGEVLTRPSMAGMKALGGKAAHDIARLGDAFLEHKLDMARAPGAQRAFLGMLRGMVRFGGFRPEVPQAARSWLPGIACPVLVIWGRNDRFLHHSHAEILRSGLPDVRVEYYDACGHLAMLEHPDKVVRDMLGFLGTVPQAPSVSG